MLHHKVIDQWGADIVSGARPPGERIGTDQAAARLGVSRTVVREAVRVLKSLGLVTVRQHVGITVTTPDRWNALDTRVVRWRLNGPGRRCQLADIREIRIANEPLAAQLAAGRASAEDRQALVDAVVAMADAARAEDPARFVSQDALFHQTLLRGSGNPMLAGLAPLVAAAITADDPSRPDWSGCAPAELMVHAGAAAAIQARDADRAREIVGSMFAHDDRPLTTSNGPVVTGRAA